MAQPERFIVTAREFPDYPLDSLPHMPAHWEDTSWHNDASPSYRISDRLMVFVDYADASKREFSLPDQTAPRFVLLPLEDGQHIQAEAVAHGDEFTEILASAIAETFARRLGDILTANEWAEMRRVNVDHESDGVCASHDYCDANMPMADAFEEVIGREPEPADEADAALWSRAWDIAKARHLTDAKGN